VRKTAAADLAVAWRHLREQEVFASVSVALESEDVREKRASSS
jgi:hypothetical protein